MPLTLVFARAVKAATIATSLWDLGDLPSGWLILVNDVTRGFDNLHSRLADLS
jgi:hypothetical protein